MALPLNLRFTDSGAPLFIDIEGDSSEVLFVISTSHVHNGTSNTSVDASSSSIRHPPHPANATMTRKRERDAHSPMKKPMKAVHRADPTDAVRVAGSSNVLDGGFRSQTRMPDSGLMLPPPVPLSHLLSISQPQEPLFLPGSQMSLANSQSLHESGLG